MGLGFGRDARLVRRGEFAALLKSGRRQRGHWFSLFVLVQARADGARLGVVAPKRFAPKAVQRNLVKRIAREQFRSHRAQLGAIDVLLQLRQRLPALPLAALKAPLTADVRALLEAASTFASRAESAGPSEAGA